MDRTATDMHVLIDNDEVDENGNRKKSNEKTVQFMKINCDCSAILKLYTPLKVYSTKSHTQCRDCGAYMSPTMYLLHCPNGKTEQHPKGFDLCQNCGEARWEKQKLAKEKLQQEQKASQALQAHQGKQIAMPQSTMIETAESKEANDIDAEKGILYNNLYSMVSEKLVQEKLKLKETVDKLSDDPWWKKMISFKQYRDERGSVNLRQDSSEYLTFPNKLGISVRKLETLKMKDFYDSKIYLPNLMIVAKSLDSKFHNVMKNVIFQKDFNVEYVRGPLKTIERAQAKAESDYSARAFPNSACLVDIVRCQCVYENPSDLCEALDATMARIEKGDTVIKRVLRVKNLLRFINCLLLGVTVILHV